MTQAAASLFDQLQEQFVQPVGFVARIGDVDAARRQLMEQCVDTPFLRHVHCHREIKADATIAVLARLPLFGGRVERKHLIF